jgi:cell division protein FtsQ
MIRRRSPARKVLGTLALSFIPVLLANSALFSIRAVQMEGLNDTQRAQVKPQVAQLKGKNILSLSLEDVRAVFGAVGWIRDVEIRKVLPGKLQVRVVPRRAVGLWIQPSGEALVDSGGNLYIGDPSETAGPILLGHPKAGDLRALAEFLAENEGLARRLTAVELTPHGETIFMDGFGHRLLVDLITARPSLELFERTVRECPVVDHTGLVDIRKPGRFVLLG